MENLNLVELLKECPKGMELDCVLNDNVTFECILDGHCYPIQIQTPEGNMQLSEYGCLSLSKHAKCVIFPKGKTTWEGFVPPCKFKDGDVLTYMYCNKPTIYIYRENGCCNTSYYAGYSFANESFYKGNIGGLSGDRTDLRLATEEEKAKLFDAIKDNGYRWNDSTKTLEKLIEPIFKVGDRIKNRIKKGEKIETIVRIYENCYDVSYDGGFGSFTIDLQDQYELVPNKFDITTFKPFDKVLYRMHHNDTWLAGFYNVCIKNKIFVIGLSAIPYCIPYENNQHLLGTTNDCDDYYKTWEK